MSTPKPPCPCGNGKPIYCKGLCQPCYQRAWLATKPLCACGNGESVYRKGLCSPCYYQALSATKPLCDCGNGRPVYRKGLCRPCYQRALSATKPPCPCGNGEPVHYEGLCRPCYYQVNRERFLANQKARLADPANRRRALAASKAWKDANRDEYRDKHRAATLAWRKENPGRVQVYEQQYRANKLNADDGFTHDEWLEILDAHQGLCAYCAADGPMTMDHVVPLSKGGRHHKSNIVPACKPCNSRKGTRSAEEYRAELPAG